MNNKLSVIPLGGVEEVSYKAEGNARLEGDALILEWAATRTIERVSLASIDTEVSESPIATLEVPVDEIVRARLRAAWWGLRVWGWQLELRSRHLDTFDGLPGGRLGRIVLYIRRSDRGQAAALASAIETATIEPA